MRSTRSRPKPTPPLKDDTAPNSRRTVGRRLARGLIRAYQVTFSAVFGRTCRYLPTCSDYADEAIGRHGVWAGFWMALARISRCHPLGASGHDPVPGTVSPMARWYAPWRYGRWTGRHISVRLDR